MQHTGKMANATEAPSGTTPSPFWKKARAWAVHGLTLSGLIWAALAMVAVVAGNIKLMWLFLAIALVTDAADGPLARRFEVSKYAAQFDGSIADILIDYLTWTFIPAYFLAAYGFFGSGSVPIVLFVLILVSSVFCYANVSMKTREWYFAGFPAAWNVVAVYFYLLATPVWLNIALTLFFSVITIVPITFLHPFRVRRLWVVNVIATAIWLATTVVLVVVSPLMPLVVAGFWWVSGVWIIVSGLLGGILAASRGHSL